MDALLMKEVDSSVQNAAGSGKPPASLVLDRGAVTSLQPVLLNQVKYWHCGCWIDRRAGEKGNRLAASQAGWRRRVE